MANEQSGGLTGVNLAAASTAPAAGGNPPSLPPDSSTAAASAAASASKVRDDAAAIRRMLAAKRIAIFGISDDPMKPSHSVAHYLQTVGYDIIPINPKYQRVLGVKCYPSLAAAPIDVADVFRKPEFCADVVREAIAAKVKGVWLQSGIRSAEGRKLAAEAGIDYVENRCFMVEHMHK